MPTALLFTIGAALGLFVALWVIVARSRRRRFVREYDRIEREQKGGA